MKSTLGSVARSTNARVHSCAAFRQVSYCSISLSEGHTCDGTVRHDYSETIDIRLSSFTTLSPASAQAPDMPTSKSTQTEPCNPHRITPSPSLTDPLYVAFEDTVAIIEMLLFPVDPDVSTALLDNSSQDFLEDLLDQLIEWGFDICGRSGSLRVIAATLVGHVVGQILENLQDELDKIQMQAMQWHKSR